MKILVPVKQVLDPGMNSLLQAGDLRGDGVGRVLNPFCAIALEEAIRIKERSLASEIVIVCIGDIDASKTLRKCLAMGADRAVFIKVPSEEYLCPLDIARLLHPFVLQQAPSLIIMGKQSVDYENNQVGQMLSALLGWPVINAAFKISLTTENLIAEHEADNGTQTHSFHLPGVVTVDLPLNEPRSPGLAEVMKARTKPLDIIEGESLGVSVDRHIELIETASAQRNTSLTMLTEVNQLADIIRMHAVR